MGCASSQHASNARASAAARACGVYAFIEVGTYGLDAVCCCVCFFLNVA
eukprot:COSAG02_NODE_64638_length_259_cov_0.627329_1_plen_48_part_10